jgi:hypothetical protein
MEELIVPRYRKLSGPPLRMSQASLRARREFAMGLTFKEKVPGADLKALWKENFARYAEAYMADPAERRRYLDLYALVSPDPAQQCPYHFFVLLDYSLALTVQHFLPGRFPLNDHLYFDSNIMKKESSFFCMAGEFSYWRQKYGGTFGKHFRGQTLEEFLPEHNRLIEEYYGFPLYEARRKAAGCWDLVAARPPEAARNDCIANIYIIHKAWLDLWTDQGKPAHEWRAVETACAALGDAECRFRFEHIG